MSYKSIIPVGILQCHLDNHCIICSLFSFETIANKGTPGISLKKIALNNLLNTAE